MPREAKTSFGALLRRYRAATGFSQALLAERTGLSRRGIADLERGARKFPYGDTIRRLADALELSPDERAALLAAGRRQPPETAKQNALPIDLSTLVGREREISEVQLLLKSARLVTLTGAAGIGKTRLALEVAHRAGEQFAEGVGFVDLAPLTDAALVPHTVARAVGVREQQDRSALEALQDGLGARGMLLVMDNCEHLLDSSVALVDALLRTCPQIRVLATSREGMRIRGETVWLVPSLRPEEAGQLFVERARAANATAEWSTADLSCVADICHRLDGIPLAIELAAARVPALGLSQITARLTERLQILSRGSRLDSPRHQTLRAAIDWSYALLDDQERVLLERVSVFAGGWSADALAPVCADDATSADADGILNTLVGLVEKSLVIADRRGPHVRYRLLETIREYATERLDVSGDSPSVGRRHAGYFLSLAARGGMTRRGVWYASDLDLLRREHDNLCAALRALLALGDVGQGLEMCRLLGGFWLGNGFLDEGDEWLRRFLVPTDSTPWQVMTDGLHTAGRIAEYRGAFDAAEAYLRQSLHIARQHHSTDHISRALFGLASLAAHHGNLTLAREHFGEGLALDGGERISSDIAEALVAVARIEWIQGEPLLAREHVERAVAIQRRLGDAWGLAYVLHELSQQTRDERDLERAQALEEEAFAQWTRSGSRMGQRAALMNLAVLALDRTDLARARELAQQTLELCREIADASPTTVRCVEIASEILQACGGASALVARLEAATTAQRQVLGAPMPPNERGERERTRHAAWAALPTVNFETAWQEGTHLSIRDALELAVKGLEFSGEPRVS